MHFILYPNGGLANRMRAIDSAVNLCRPKDRLKVVWYKDWGLNCAWSELFEPVPFVKDMSIPRVMRYVLKHHEDKRWITATLWVLRRLHILWLCDMKGNGDIPLVEEIRNGGYWFAVLRSWEPFFPSEPFRKNLFVLKDQERLHKELEKVGVNTVGVHIRRTDNIWSVEHSPLELFEAKMRTEMEKDPKTNFYLCSDDESVKERFRSGEWKDVVRMPEGVIDRGSVEGVVQAACEMCALSATRKIYGSFWSSFGEIAARLGNVDIEVCTAE